jgi:hypothetical protein
MQEFARKSVDKIITVVSIQEEELFCRGKCLYFKTFWVTSVRFPDLNNYIYFKQF